MATKRYTIQEVAKRAQVGVGTVSRVLNGDPKVRDTTRQHVLDVIQEVGYQPSFAARSLRTQKTHVIGLIADAVTTTPYAVNLIKGAQDAAWERGKLLLVVDADNDEQRREHAVEAMLEREVEGVIYAAMFHQQVSLPVVLSQMSTVLVDCFEAGGHFPSVVPDEVQGGREATLKLLGAGHRRVAIITNDLLNTNYPAPVGRLEGYRQALATWSVPFEPELLREGLGDAPSGSQSTLELLRLQDPPTAIFCGTDRTAMGAYEVLKSRGLTIPDDVSVVGFDNQEVIAEYLNPPLSTVALPHYEMGRWAVHHLTDGNDSSPLQHTLPCPFVERASIAGPAA